MQIKDLQARQGDIELVAKVIEKAQPRNFEKFGKQGKVCNAKLQDETGKVTLTLWNEDVDKVNVGDTIKLSKGYVGEWQGELQLSAGKFGTIEVTKGVQSSPQKVSSEEQEDLSDDFEEPDVEEEDMI